MPCKCQLNELILSPQEQWLEGITKNEDPTRERNFNRLERIRKEQIKLCTDRARYFTEGMKQNELRPLELRWALALKNVAEKIPVYIDPDELVVGRGEGRFGRCGMLYPEIDGGYMDRVGRDMCNRPDAPYFISDADYDVMVNEIAPYWKNRSFPEAFAMSLP